MSILSCAKKFALAAILLYLVISSAAVVNIVSELATQSALVQILINSSPPLFLVPFDGIELLCSCVTTDYFRVPGISFVCDPLARVPSHDSVPHPRLLGQVVVLSPPWSSSSRASSSSPCTTTLTGSRHRERALSLLSECHTSHAIVLVRFSMLLSRWPQMRSCKMPSEGLVM